MFKDKEYGLVSGVEELLMLRRLDKELDHEDEPDEEDDYK